MRKANVWIERFEPDRARAEAWRSFHRLSNAIRAEWWPDFPVGPSPPPGAPHLGSARVGLAVVGRLAPGRARGGAELELSTTPENRHLAWCDIYVHPNHRRCGIGTALLRTVAELAGEDDRRLLTFATAATAPAGEAFARRLGAKPGLVNHTNRLRLSDVDPALLRAWIERAPRDAFSLGFWEGPYPEEDLAEVCRMHEVMNTAPRGARDGGLPPDPRAYSGAGGIPPQARRGAVDGLRPPPGHGPDRRVHRGRLGPGRTGAPPPVGDRGVPRVPGARPGEVAQGRHARTGPGTPASGEVRDHRKRGGNAPMLKINHALGFRLYNTVTLWQLPVEEALAYARGRS